MAVVICIESSKSSLYLSIVLSMSFQDGISIKLISRALNASMTVLMKEESFNDLITYSRLSKL
ncbi:hypothetical protein [Acidianus sp. HS-5]|uniref:hypothetical protein n=1 Tax=Acidianus sp. HS-5 TaxID=2886040 RepID=UPI001F37FA35|nr:hypothetical protein [Acidianus sp. HS-5]BDC17332.1 hypothetical protein HS5_02220 [Acidianus sp. HS-5]